MKANYHTHHELCKHAIGNTEDYVQEAIEKGLEELGMSDHAPFEWMGDPRRMTDKEFLDYLEEYNVVKEKYKDKISLKIALEAEYYPFHEDKYEYWLSKVDYLILGQHYIYYNNDLSNLVSGFDLGSIENIEQYGKIVVEAMNSGYFKIFAHPDVCFSSIHTFDDRAESVARMICKAAEETGTLLEYNGNGYRRWKVQTPEGEHRPYPRNEFFKIAEEYDVKIILSSDAHAPKQLVDETMKVAEVDFNKLGSKKVTKIKW